MVERVVLLAAAGAFLLLNCGPQPVAGQETPEDAADPALVEALLELEAAGLAPSAEELSSWLGAEGDPTGDGTRFGVPGHGVLRVRGYFLADDPWRQDGRLDLRSGPVRLRGRFVQGGEQSGLAGGALELELASVHLTGGYLGLQGGLGLLLASSGRSASLAADGGLGQPRAHVRSWATWPDSRTLEGAGADLTWGRLRFQAVGGRNVLTGRKLTGGSLAWQGNGGLLGVSGLHAGSENGFSAWGTGAAGLLEWAGEGACWMPEPGGQPNLSWQAVLALAPGPDWGLHGGLGQARGGDSSPLGARPTFLAGDEGKGWALGGHWKPRRAWKLSLLTTDSVVRSLTSEARLDAERVWDALATGQANSRLRWNLRLRSRSQRRWLWSARYPWQPAALLPREARLQGQFGLEWKADRRRVKGGLRWLQVSTPEGASRRLMGFLAGNWTWGGRWCGRAGYGTAWGEEVDLVSAVAPFPGLVLPRHWGGWRSETYAGVGHERGRQAVWAAVSWRRPDGVAAAPGSWQAWVDCRVAW